jgi:glycerophosphoryl diester phosphodiesterase
MFSHANAMLVLAFAAVCVEADVKCARGDRVVSQYSNGLWYSGVILWVHSSTSADILADDGNAGAGWQGVGVAQVLKSSDDGNQLEWCWRAPNESSVPKTFQVMGCTEFATAEPTPGKGPVVMAHRGCCRKGSGFEFAPENTLAAFAYAASVGAHMFETDLHLTMDGEIVLLHDSTLDRTTNCTGPVAGLTLAELQSCDAGSWLNESFAGERVPTLIDAMQLAKKHGMTIILDLKVPGLGPKIASAMLRADFSMADAIPSINFQSDNAEIVASLAKSAIMINQAGMMPGKSGADGAYFANLRGHGIDIIFPSSTSLEVSGGTNFSNSAHIRGMQVWTWTVDNPAGWRKAMNEGVGAICTNNPAGLIATASIAND